MFVFAANKSLYFVSVEVTWIGEFAMVTLGINPLPAHCGMAE